MYEVTAEKRSFADEAFFYLRTGTYLHFVLISLFYGDAGTVEYLDLVTLEKRSHLIT